MIEPKFIEMMNMELDGVLPERDRAMLRKYLASQPEADAYFEGLKSAFSVVDAVGQVDPPEGQIGRILEAVPFVRREHSIPGPGFVDRLRAWFRTPQLRYAAVFVIGILLGGLFYSAMTYDSRQSGGEIDINDFVGSIGHITTSERFRKSGLFEVELDRVTGSVSLHQSPEVLLAEVRLGASGTIDWVIEYDGENVSLDGYRSSDGTTGEVVVRNDRLRVSQSGESHYLLYFTRKTDAVEPLIVKIYSADRLLLEHAISPAAKSANQ